MVNYIFTREVEASKIHSIKSDQEDDRPIPYRGWVLVLENDKEIPVSREWQSINRAKLGSWLVLDSLTGEMQVVHDAAFERDYKPVAVPVKVPAEVPDPFATFEDVARPLIQWVNDHANPHSHVIITCDSATMAGDLVSFQTDDYLKD